MLFQTNKDEDEWKKILYHEAGHAAMAAFLWQETADMYLYRKPNKNGLIEKTAKYKINIGVSCNLPGEPQAINKSGLDQVMVVVAGAMVERIKYGKEGEGCTTDFAKVKEFPTHHNDKVALDEIENDFPLSLQQTNEIIDLVEEIAKASINAFIDKDLINDSFEEELILDKSFIDELYKSYKRSIT